MNLPQTVRPTMTPKTKEKATQYYYYFLPVLCLVLVALLAYAVGIPEYQNIQKAWQDKKIKSELDTKLQSKLSQLQQLDADELRVSNDKLKYILPSEKDPAWVLSGITQIASENNVTITSIQTFPGPLATPSAEIKPTLEFLRVLVNVKGSLDGIKAMVNTLASTGRIYKTKELNMSPPGSTGEQQYSGDMELKAYYQSFPSGRLTSEDESVEGLSAKQRKIFEQISGFEIKGLIFPTDSLGEPVLTQPLVVETPVVPPPAAAAPEEPEASESAAPAASPSSTLP